jgi:hypothetical protein
MPVSLEELEEVMGGQLPWQLVVGTAGSIGVWLDTITGSGFGRFGFGHFALWLLLVWRGDAKHAMLCKRAFTGRSFWD